MKTLLSLILLLFALTAFSQVPEPAMLWLKGYGGDGGDQVLKEVTKTADGGFIIGIEAGSDAHTGNIDSFCALTGDRTIFLKYNADASVLEWNKCFWISGDTSVSYVFPTADGGFVLGGNYVTNGFGLYICKQDAAGNILWGHGYSVGNSASMTCMMATDDGGYIMAGGCNYTDTNFTDHYGSWMNSDICVIKVDSIGKKVWSRVIGGTGDEFAAAIVPAPESGCYIIGTTPSDDNDLTGNHGDEDCYSVRLDKNGNIIWSREYGGSNFDRATYVQPDSKGGLLIAASTESIDGNVMYSLAGATGECMWVLSIDSSGNVLWNNCYGGGGYAYTSGICMATDGSIWISGVSGVRSGEVDTAYGRDDAYFVHTDGSGNFINAKVLGSTMDDRGFMIYPLSNGNVVAGGFYGGANGTFSGQFYGGDDAFLVEFEPWDQTGMPQIQTIKDSAVIYPNPTQEEANINIGKSGKYHIIITSVIGKIIFETDASKEIRLTVSNWAKGIYYVQVNGVDGYRNTQKLIVE